MVHGAVWPSRAPAGLPASADAFIGVTDRGGGAGYGGGPARGPPSAACGIAVLVNFEIPPDLAARCGGAAARLPLRSPYARWPGPRAPDPALACAILPVEMPWRPAFPVQLHLRARSASPIGFRMPTLRASGTDLGAVAGPAAPLVAAQLRCGRSPQLPYARTCWPRPGSDRRGRRSRFVVLDGGAA